MRLGSDVTYRLAIIVAGVVFLILFAYLDARFVAPFVRSIGSETGRAIIKMVPAMLFVPLIGWSLWNPVLVGILIGVFSKARWYFLLFDIFVASALYTALQWIIGEPFSFFQIHRGASMSGIALYFIGLWIAVALPTFSVLGIRATHKILAARSKP